MKLVRIVRWIAGIAVAYDQGKKVRMGGVFLLALACLSSCESATHVRRINVAFAAGMKEAMIDEHLTILTERVEVVEKVNLFKASRPVEIIKEKYPQRSKRIPKDITTQDNLIIFRLIINANDRQWKKLMNDLNNSPHIVFVQEDLNAAYYGQ